MLTRKTKTTDQIKICVHCQSVFNITSFFLLSSLCITGDCFGGVQAFQVDSPVSSPRCHQNRPDLCIFRGNREVPIPLSYSRKRYSTTSFAANNPSKHASILSSSKSNTTSSSESKDNRQLQRQRRKEGRIKNADKRTLRSDSDRRSKNDGSIQLRLSELRQRQENNAAGKGGNPITQEECDSLLADCVAADQWDSVLDVIDLFKLSGLAQVKSSYRACLRACEAATNAASSQEILNAMISAGVAPDATDVALTVTTMCRKERSERGWWRRALNLLISHGETLQLPIEAYDSVLSCCQYDRQWKEAVQLLRQMQSETSQTNPALSTYRIAIQCTCAAKQAEQAVQILQSACREGLTPTSDMFERIVAALAKKRQWRRALQLLEMMEEKKVPKNVVLYNHVLTATSKAGEVVQAKYLFTQMKKSGIAPNIISYNAVISACANARRWKDALSILNECSRASGVEPDIYTYTNAIRACAKGGKMRTALELLQVVKHKRLPLDAYCYTAVIEACAKAKVWEKALELLKEMKDAGISPSPITYSVAISACGNAGQWQKALDLLEVMRSKNMPINVITYNEAITALSKAAKSSSPTTKDKTFNQLWIKVNELLDQMRADGLEPDGFSYSAAMACCGAQGRWQEALELIDLMEAGGPRTRPNKVSYTAAISSCGKSGQVDHAIRLFRQMKEQGLSADRVAYNALFYALRVAKKADMAFDLWNEMVGNTTSPSLEDRRPRAIATLPSSPDIITVTDAIAAISSSDSLVNRERVDHVFAAAVDRGIIFRKNILDSAFEVDLSGMSFPVARAACRYILKRMLQQERSKKNNGKKVQDLSFITGLGKHHADKGETTLREFVQQVLEVDFSPPVASIIPPRAKGTVQIDRAILIKWIAAQETAQQ